MAPLGVRKLRQNLHEVLEFVLMKNGRVIITQHGEPVAQIVPVSREQCLPARLRSGSPSVEPAQGSHVQT